MLPGENASVGVHPGGVTVPRRRVSAGTRASHYAPGGFDGGLRLRASNGEIHSSPENPFSPGSPDDQKPGYEFGGQGPTGSKRHPWRAAVDEPMAPGGGPARQGGPGPSARRRGPPPGRPDRHVARFCASGRESGLVRRHGYEYRVSRDRRWTPTIESRFTARGLTRPPPCGPSRGRTS